MPPRPVVPSDDLYARLEVPASATFEAIEIAWRALLKRHHPDVAGAAGLETAKRINVAHDWLSNPELRARYDHERAPRASGIPRTPGGPRSPGPPRSPYTGGTTGSHEPAAPWRGPVDARRTRRTTPTRRRAQSPAEALRRFLDRVGRLDRDELDRLSVAETNSIAFVASIRRFLSPDQLAAVDDVEREVRARLGARAWANGAIRDAVLAAAHELVLGGFLDEHLTEPFRGRARDRLVRGWEAAIDQPRYGPNTTSVERLINRAAALTPDDARAIARASGRGRIPDDPWPRGLEPDDHEGLRVSSTLAARDAIAAAAGALAPLDRATAARAARLLRRTAHAVVLRHGFTATQYADLVGPWTSVTGDPGTGRTPARPADARVRRTRA